MPPLTATTPQSTFPSTFNEWYILAGYPVVIVSDMTLFVSLRTNIPQRPLCTRYDEHLEVEGVGIVILPISGLHLIFEAAYVPTAQRNVFPVFVFSRLGLGIVFDEDGITFTFRNGELVLRAYRVGTPESISHVFVADLIALNTVTHWTTQAITTLEASFDWTGELHGRPGEIHPTDFSLRAK